MRGVPLEVNPLVLVILCEAAHCTGCTPTTFVDGVLGPHTYSENVESQCGE